ncbi:ATP synthase epsilon chain 2 [Youhaiella tibetensis]|uniref:ATP synthase epsilon chain n=1 Tax=Paradevosia tibetensis TaxID=1447062 RepID=A0A5B9DNW0_9HYPH|nr:F0F1 ATP synthase subunit epsilon [Youhaiella tibetensis]QEE20897.1 F0F1 ATP synthase subunit epsilon [Youhaiella tibetensis]GGF20081.1 ATP synthase epsilon chain 2 [Youhaiella tibetensis]
MTGLLQLTVSTPLQIVLVDNAVASLRAEDASGSFGILPGHADFLTVIDAGVMRWRGATEDWRYCALRGGIFAVTGGTHVRIACREAIVSDELAALESRVAAARLEAENAIRNARTSDTRLHARAIRQLMHELSAGGDTLGLFPEGDP